MEQLIKDYYLEYVDDPVYVSDESGLVGVWHNFRIMLGGRLEGTCGMFVYARGGVRMSNGELSEEFMCSPEGLHYGDGIIPPGAPDISYSYLLDQAWDLVEENQSKYKAS